VKIRLTKVEGVLGKLDVGTSIVVSTPPEMDERDSRVRAFRMLERDHPQENLMCWKAVRACGICGRELLPQDELYGKGDPRLDCGGDCAACMWSVEQDCEPQYRCSKPDEFESGMHGDPWTPPGEAP
jgi:hypothetical protein